LGILPKPRDGDGWSGGFVFDIDSCTLHVADLFRVPGLGLFGPSSCTEYGFRFAPHRHICGPDQTMASIGETDVLDVLESLYKEVSHL